MNYTVEDISPVRKRVSVTVSPEEVNAALSTQVALILKQGVKIPGYRPGKVPASVVESRFHKEVYNSAKQDLLSAQINDILQGSGLEPLSGLEMVGEADKAFVRNQPYTYTMEFDVLPVFDLPVYDGLTAEVEKEEWNHDVIYQYNLLRLRRKYGQFVKVDSQESPAEGDYVTGTFYLRENGQPVENWNPRKFNRSPFIKDKFTPEIYTALQNSVVGETKVVPVSFPENFVNENFAGKTFECTVHLNKIERLEIPEADDAFAKKCAEENGLNIETLEQLREYLINGQKLEQQAALKNTAQSQLIDQLMKVVDFPLPPGLLESNVKRCLKNVEDRLALDGKGLQALAKTDEERRAKVMPDAEYYTRLRVLMMAIAKKEGLQATEAEINQSIFEESKRQQVDFHRLRAFYDSTGTTFLFRDQILVDKAANLIYERAKVTFTEPKKNEPTKDEAAATEKTEAVKSAEAETTDTPAATTTTEVADKAEQAQG